ncbi:Putative transposase (fragment) [Bradyrhizobium sp. ORS 285]
MSERRACKAVGCCRMTVRYQTSRADDVGLRRPGNWTIFG